MDRYRKKQYIATLDILAMKYKEVLRDITRELPDDAFDEDYKLMIEIGKLREANQDLLEVIKEL